MTASASDYSWIHETPLSVACCLTVVTGETIEEVLAALGVDAEQGATSGSEAYVGVAPGPGTGGLFRIGVVQVTGAALMVEDNGFLGSLPDVLARLSAGGRAASMFWNVNEHNAFSFAENGHLTGSVDLYDAENPGYADEIDLPVELRELFESAGSEGADLHAIGLAMVARFTGVDLRAEDVARLDIDTLRGV